MVPSAPQGDSNSPQCPPGVEEALGCVTKLETSLSPRVYSILQAKGTGGGRAVTLGGTLLHRGDSTLDWSVVARYFDEGLLVESKDLTKGAEQCGLLSEHLHQQWSENRDLRVKIRNTSNFLWTPQPEVYVKCLDILDEDQNKLQVNTVILLAAAALERALGDVFLSVSTTSKQCPHLLRDLLVTKELERTFSPLSMFLLRCLIGPPTGLNLRNILWHGFADHQEVPCKFAVLVLVLVASLGRMLSTQTNSPAIVHRPFVTFPPEVTLCKTFKDLPPDSCRCLHELFSCSYFIIPTMLPTWQAALQAFLDQEYTVCLCLLLPSLEHGLRRVFACVNNCPERALTAEADTLYTTFDEILSPSLPTGEPNKLVEEIGSAKMEMLLDLLVHPEGLRLRDSISHGEVEFYKIGRGLANHVLCLGAVFCAQYLLTTQQQMDKTLSDCLAVESCYTSLFHPISLLKEEMEELVANQWTTIPIPANWTAEATCSSPGTPSQTPCPPPGTPCPPPGTPCPPPGAPSQTPCPPPGTPCPPPGAPSQTPCPPPGAPSQTPCHPPGAPSQTPCHPPGAPSQTPCPPPGAPSQTPYPPPGTPISQTCQFLYSNIQSRLHHTTSPRRPQQPTLVETLRRVWSQLATLFVPRQQLELVGIMRRIVSHMTKAITQVRETAIARYSQYENQELRSRQRTNYHVLVTSLPLYRETSKAVVLFLALTAASLQTKTTSLSTHIKFLKKVLQFSENFYSLTSPTRNRWEEANKLCRAVTQSVHQQATSMI